MSKKITKEELEKLQELVKSFNQHQAKIGEVELEKHKVLHSVDAVQKSIMELQNELKEVYGDCTIDINDGTIKELEDEPNTED